MVTDCDESYLVIMKQTQPRSQFNNPFLKRKKANSCGWDIVLENIWQLSWEVNILSELIKRVIVSVLSPQMLAEYNCYTQLIDLQQIKTW